VFLSDKFCTRQVATQPLVNKFLCALGTYGMTNHEDWLAEDGYKYTSIYAKSIARFCPIYRDLATRGHKNFIDSISNPMPDTGEPPQKKLKSGDEKGGQNGPESVTGGEL
jgi:hypothetical protein